MLHSGSRGEAHGIFLLALILLTFPSTVAEEPTGGVIVEGAEPLSAAAGLLEADQLLSWRRLASPPANPEEARGRFDSPFDLAQLLVEQAPRGEILISGRRSGVPFITALPADKSSLRVRPSLRPHELMTYRRGRALWEGGDLQNGLALWREMGERWRAAGKHETASWMFYRIGQEYGREGRFREAATSFEQAILEAAQLDATWALAHLHYALARQRKDPAGQRIAFQKSLEISESFWPKSLTSARALNGLGNVAFVQSQLNMAEDYHLRALELREELSPVGRDVAISLLNLAGVASRRGDLDLAEAHLLRAHAITEQIAPGSRDQASALVRLGNLASRRQNTAVATERYQQALALLETVAPKSYLMAVTLNNLANQADERGDLEAAEEYFLRARDLISDPGQLLASILGGLGMVAERRGALGEAEAFHVEALAMRKKLNPEGLDVAESLSSLSGIAIQRGDTTRAAEYLRHTLKIYERLAPGSTDEARVCYRLAVLARQVDNPDLAARYFHRALAAHASQRQKFGGSDETTSRWAASFADYYFDAIDFFLEQGQPDTAFHILERYRAQGLLALYAGRDLEAILSTDLERDLRRADREYDATLRRLALLSSDGDHDRQQRELTGQLREARRRQDEVKARIRGAAPRRAPPGFPETLDLEAVRQLLDPGTLLLSYVIGQESSYLFAVGAGGLEVFTLPVSHRALRLEVKQFRDLLLLPRRKPHTLLLLGARLTDTLLAPARDQIARADRLLIVPDGPLHSLPFAALADPTTPKSLRYLVEGKASTVVASATIFSELEKKRRDRTEIRVSAFGDPRYPKLETADESTQPELHSALARGFRLDPLPSTRAELTALQEIFPDTSRLYLGPEATEDRVKALGKESSILHFACHAWIDPRSPLESALALSIPETWRKGQENGLLQVWEIFEHLRIEADLVTLSACETALGEELAGEGMMGFSRAFHYAGARSVLASLWEVDDRSTSELMKQFYSHLKHGLSKDEALRAAQIGLLRGPEAMPYAAHPFHWAAFEMIGDWK